LRQLQNLPGPPGRPLLIVADHQAVAAVLRDRPEGFRRTDRLETIGLEMGLFGVNGDAWKRQRHMVMAAFDPGHVKAYYPSLANAANACASAGRPPPPRGPTICRPT